MTIARKHLIPKNANAFVHVINRCVRRAYLCGTDPDSIAGRNYDHRKQWIVDRVKFLTSVFAIDVAAFAVMSNHYHIVTYVDYDRSLTWSDEEVISRWLRLFAPKDKNGVKQKVTQGHIEELIGDKERIAGYREQLADLSWFMRNINGPIARRANIEDNCKGRFWEGRFKSKLLLDETALITCMAYVDLNPIRAGMCETLEDSEYTSIAERLERWRTKPKASQEEKVTAKTKAEKQEKTDYPWLLGLVGEKQPTNNPYHSSFQPLIAFEDYVKLVEWTGKAMRHDKKGIIPGHIKPVLESLQANPSNWTNTVKHFDSRFFYAVGQINKMMDEAVATGRQWFKGKTSSLLLYKSSEPPAQI